MNTIVILLAVAAVLLVVVLVVVPGIRALLYSRSDEWKIHERMLWFVQHEQK